MTADQIRSLQPALAALLETFRPYLGRASNCSHLLAYILGLIADLKRKSIEPIALAAGVAVRTLQEFLSFLDWDLEAANDHLQRQVMDRHGCPRAIAVLDASGHAKQGRHTPGVARQYCGETGKLDNCVVGQHLLYCDNDPGNPFHCALASDLQAAFARWSIELWFERAKQEAGLGAFEVRTYRSLLRHWFCARLAMYFLAQQTQRLRGEKSAHHAGTGGPGGQRPGLDDLETHLAIAG